MSAIDAALLEIQKKLPVIEKDTTGQYGKFASLPHTQKIAFPILHEFGCVVQNAIVDNKLQTSIIHAETGDRITSEMPLNITEAPQKIGAQITYYKRYNLQGLLGIATEEDLDNRPAESPKVSQESFRANNDSVNSTGSTSMASIACTECGTDLRQSKSGKGYYCPNFKTPGDHTRMTAAQYQERLGEMSTPQMDTSSEIPF